MRREADGWEGELRANAALLFDPEYGRQPANRRRRYLQAPEVAFGTTVAARRIVADSSGSVRMEVAINAPHEDDTDNTLTAVLETPVRVVDAAQTELVSIGFPLTRAYVDHSGRTAQWRGDNIEALLREGVGSPFLFIVKSAADAGPRKGRDVEGFPPPFFAVTFELAELAGRSTGVWRLWTSVSPTAWFEPLRMLARIICQLSEVTTLLALQDDPTALAPHELDGEKTSNFLRTRAGQLRRPRQGGWHVTPVQAFAAQHLKVAVDEALHSRHVLGSFLRTDVANDLESSLRRIRRDEITAVAEGGASMDQTDRMLVVDILARQAGNAEDFFARLLRQSPLPERFKQQMGRWSGDHRNDALRLVDWALSKRGNPEQPGHSTLASILLEELEQLGREDAVAIVAVLFAYGLVTDVATRERLRVRYRIPLADGADPTEAALGPDIDWRGPTDAVELESFLRPTPPEFLSVAFLRRAVSMAASVCRVRVAATGATGTGVLLGGGFVLTSYHVLVREGTYHPPARHAASVVLSFAAYEDGGATIDVGLDANDPVPVSSPVSELDFVLLRAGARDRLEDNAPMAISRAVPAMHSSVCILQHPLGGVMQLAPSDNAVTHSDAGRGILQYTTRTADGSSGAPCFDADWRLTAIHHAERSTTFGKIREGILIDAILNVIASTPGIYSQILF